VLSGRDDSHVLAVWDDRTERVEKAKVVCLYESLHPPTELPMTGAKKTCVVCLFVCLFVCLLVSLFVCLFVCLLVCLFVCLLFYGVMYAMRTSAFVRSKE